MVAMEVGLVLACVLFVRRMATLFKVHATSADGLAWRLHGRSFLVPQTSSMCCLKRPKPYRLAAP